jgi:Recombinase
MNTRVAKKARMKGNRKMGSWTEDIIQRMLINPFYAITFAPQLTLDHIPPMSESEWIQINASTISTVSAEKWLEQLLDALEGKFVANDEHVNPFSAINIHQTNDLEHPPLITRELWIEANIALIKEMGAEKWLKQLLDVLVGDFVASENVTFTERSQIKASDYQKNIRGKKKRKKKHKK